MAWLLKIFRHEIKLSSVILCTNAGKTIYPSLAVKSLNFCLDKSTFMRILNYVKWDKNEDMYADSYIWNPIHTTYKILKKINNRQYYVSSSFKSSSSQIEWSTVHKLKKTACYIPCKWMITAADIMYIVKYKLFWYSPQSISYQTIKYRLFNMDIQVHYPGRKSFSEYINL
jgi:hypothetical protein